MRSSCVTADSSFHAVNFSAFDTAMGMIQHGGCGIHPFRPQGVSFCGSANVRQKTDFCDRIMITAKGGCAMEIGIYSFGERTVDPETGKLIEPAERIRRLLEEIELADQVGLDVFGIGEHHRPDYVVSAPAVVLAAAAARTRRIRLTSAVNVLSSDDPVRVFQQFATLDLISGGRAEIMVGRGSFIESFPLFGCDLDDYDALFEEKLDLLLKLRESETVTWSGRFRPAIDGRGVYPRPLQQPIPVWIASGGTPESAVRAGVLGLPMALAIIGGIPERFVPIVRLFRAAAERAGHPTPKLGINSHGFLPTRRRRPRTSPSPRSRRSWTSSAASAAGRRFRGNGSSCRGRCAAPISSEVPSR